VEECDLVDEISVACKEKRYHRLTDPTPAQVGNLASASFRQGAA
jgi:hypothetical protein